MCKELFIVTILFLTADLLRAETLPPLGQRLYLLKSNPALPVTIIDESKAGLAGPETKSYLKDPGYPKIQAKPMIQQSNKKVRLKVAKPEKYEKAEKKKLKTGNRPLQVTTGESYFTAKAKFPRAKLKQDKVNSHIQEAPIRIDYQGRTQASERQLLEVK